MNEERDINVKGKRTCVSAILATLAVVAVVGLLARIAVKDYEETVTAEVKQRLTTIAGLQAESIRSSILNYLHELRMLAENPRVKKAIVNNESAQDILNTEGYSPELAVYKDHLEDSVDGLYRLDAKGIIQSRIPFAQDRVGADSSDKPGVRNVIETHKLYISGIFPAFSGDKCFAICWPVFEDEQFIGIIRELVYVDTMNREVAKIKVGKNGYAQVIDNDGIIIAHPNKELLTKNMIAARKEAYPDRDWSGMEDIVARMTRGEEGTGCYHSVWWDAEEPEFVKKLTAFAPVRLPGKLWSVGVIMGYDEICRPIKAFARHVALAAGALILVFVAGGVWFYNLRKDKIRLAAKAQSADELLKLNSRLKEEIVAHKQVEEDLIKARKEAEAANEIKSQFLANMSHEIRTPMNSVIGFSELLSQENLTGDQREYVRLIRDCGRDLMEIINDILDISKIEAGKVDIETSEFSLEELLDGIESMMRPQAEKKNLAFRINQCEQLPSKIHTDPYRLRQCLLNLTGNALKFTKRGHVHVNVSAHENKGESFVRFDIEDTGIGIPADRQEDIFELFTQVDGSHTREYGGAGLGLAITKHLTELMNGELSFAGEEGKGSVFSLVIPVGVEGDSGSCCKTKESTMEPCYNSADCDSSQLSGRVMVVENIFTDQQLTKTLLERMGLQVEVAGDGAQAVEKALSESFDLILMDIQMPGLNGLEATKKLREEGITTAIVALTACAMHEDRDKCMAAGCDDYISKPIDPDELRRVLKKYVPAVSVSA